MERRLAAILAADVVGYTAMMGSDERGTLRRLTELRQEILEPLINEHHGRIVKLMGDGMLVEFASVVETVACALAWQEQVARHESRGNANNRLRFRIGINLGDVIVQGSDIHGDGVNIAARLEGLADPEGVCLSDDAYRQVKGKTGAVFEDMGEQNLKNLAEPIRVYRLATDQSAVATAKETLSPAEKPSIAILPFINMSGDPEQEYFADGITEDIITDLSRFRELLVIGSKSSFRYKGKADEAPSIARSLGVQYLVEGSLRRAGGRLRVSVQLIEAESNVHLWAERYDRKTEDLFLLQDEIVESVVQTLVGRLRSASESRASRKASHSLAAYDHVLQARAIVSDSREKVRRCLALYEAAIKLDPKCGQAYAGLAATYSLEWTSGWSDSRRDSLDRAMDCARTAASLDNLDSEAQRRLGALYLFRGEGRLAETHLNRALVLNPNDADAMAYQGLYQIYQGRPLDALTELESATRRNPFHPTFYFWFVGLAYYCARRYEEAIAPLHKAIAAFPNFVTPHRHLAACYAQLGQGDAARNERAIILELEPEFSIMKIAKTFAYSNPSDLEHYCAGLRKAGLPE
jgi:TolB-like protein